MRLITKEIEAKFKKLGKQEGDEAIVVVKLFCPWNSWTWFITEYDPETKCCFGLVHGKDKEYGYFQLDELEAIQKWSLKIERDSFFNEQPVKNFL